MKRKTSFAFALGSAAILSLAFAAPAEAGRIGNRQERQQQRIGGGVSSDVAGTQSGASPNGV